MYAIKEERTKQTDSRIKNQKSEKTRDNHINFPKTMQRKESSISPKEYFNQRIENSLGKHYNIVHTQEKNREYLAKDLIQKQHMETCQNKSMTFTNPKRLSLLSGVDFSLGASHVVQRSKRVSEGNSNKLSDDVFRRHILPRHGSNSAYKDKSHFDDDFDIKKAIDETLRSHNSIVKSNTLDRDGTIFELTFTDPIGKDLNGKPINTLKVVTDPTGDVITAFPKK